MQMVYCMEDLRYHVSCSFIVLLFLLLQACTGKFSPLFQWLYFDSLESLKEGSIELPEADVKPCDSRYDGQTAVFGREFQKQLGDLKYFLVIYLYS